MAKLEDIPCNFLNALRRETFNDPAVGADLGCLGVDLLTVFGPPEPGGNVKCSPSHIHSSFKNCYHPKNKILYRVTILDSYNLLLT